jgi:hypothetical protein
MESKRLSNIEWAKGMLDEFGEFENLGNGRIWQEDFDQYFDRLREIFGDGPPSGWVEVEALKLVILLGDCKGKFGVDFNFDIVIESEGDGEPSKEVITINY